MIHTDSITWNHADHKTYNIPSNQGFYLVKVDEEYRESTKKEFTRLAKKQIEKGNSVFHNLISNRQVI